MGVDGEAWHTKRNLRANSMQVCEPMTELNKVDYINMFIDSCLNNNTSSLMVQTFEGNSIALLSTEVC